MTSFVVRLLTFLLEGNYNVRNCIRSLGDHERVPPRYRHAGGDPEAARRRRIAPRPCDEGRGKVRAREVRERVTAANARLEIGGVTLLADHESVAVENADVAQVLSDARAQRSEE